MTNFKAKRAWSGALVGAGLVLAASCTVDKGGILFDDEPFEDGDADSDGGDSDDGGQGGIGGESSSSGGSGAGTGGRPGGDCENGELSCDGRQVQMCVFGQTIDVGGECTNACVDGGCGGVCVPGSSQCIDNRNVQICDEEGTWHASTCPVNQACVAADGACGGVCEPGNRDCAGTPDGGKPRVRVCSDDGQWVENTNACPQSCTNGVCVGCTTIGATQCEDKFKIQTCDGSSWGAGVACNASACVDDQCSGVCVPESRSCTNDSSFRVCSDVGAWGTSVSCKNQACVAGSCVGECQPGLQRCAASGLGIEVCNSSGQWTTDTTCDKGLSCIPYGEKFICGECQPGSRRCDQEAVQACSKEGKWEVEEKCAAPSVLCWQGSCVSATKLKNACTEGLSSPYGCFGDGKNYFRCTRKVFSGDACPLKTSCDGDSGVCD